VTQIFHPSAQISSLADLEDSARGSVLTIEENVVIESFVKVKFAGGSGNVTIGQRSYVNAGVVIYSGNGISIGRGVLIAANCTLAATNHRISDRSRFIRDQGFARSKGGIIIEDDVWIGANSVILDGSVIRKGAVIGAGSCVRGEVPAFAIMVGQPLRHVGVRGKQEDHINSGSGTSEEG
jgi:acetyltransferase-like isoleucine patch superfamily enzyme